MPQNNNASNGLVLKLTLQDIAPQIWREVAVESTDTLEVLHQIIQSLFLWDDAHQHEFCAQGKIYMNLSHFDAPERGELEERETQIGLVLKGPKDKMTYEYDFGDSWTIEIEVVRPFSIEDSPYQTPVCLAGERAAPPDDIGGVPGYMALVEAIKDPDSVEGKKALSWIGKPWDPNSFDLNAANYILAMQLDGFYHDETTDILNEYMEIVIGQLESKAPSFVEKTFTRLTEQGMDQEAALSAMALAFVRERHLSKGKEKIDEKVYAKLLDQLPEMPWLSELAN